MASSYAAGDLAWDIDRLGGDYKNFPIYVNNPMLCKEACGGEPRCKALTYVKPGVQGAYAKCWLKSTVPAASTSSNAISGVKPN